jgi:hypothetical protein
LSAATLLVARERNRMAKRVAVKPKVGTEAKAAGAGGRVKAVKSMLAKIETTMAGGQMKATLGDYIRLVQLHKELDDESPKEIRVTWLEPAEKGSAKEE